LMPSLVVQGYRLVVVLGGLYELLLYWDRCQSRFGCPTSPMNISAKAKQSCLRSTIFSRAVWP
jgi:hypothetical protein